MLSLMMVVDKVSEEAKNKVNILFLTDTTKSTHEYKLRSLFVADNILRLSSCFHAWVSNFLCFLKVREHIKSFPRQTSHYSRKDVPLRRYLLEDLSAQRMHHMYLKLQEHWFLFWTSPQRCLRSTRPQVPYAGAYVSGEWHWLQPDREAEEERRCLAVGGLVQSRPRYKSEETIHCYGNEAGGLPWLEVF